MQSIFFNVNSFLIFLNLMLFYSRYMAHIKTTRGDTYELMIEALLNSGQSSFSNVLLSVAKSLNSLKAEGLFFTHLILHVICF